MRKKRCFSVAWRPLQEYTLQPDKTLLLVVASQTSMEHPTGLSRTQLQRWSLLSRSLYLEPSRNWERGGRGGRGRGGYGNTMAGCVSCVTIRSFHHRPSRLTFSWAFRLCPLNLGTRSFRIPLFIFVCVMGRGGGKGGEKWRWRMPRRTSCKYDNETFNTQRPKLQYALFYVDEVYVDLTGYNQICFISDSVCVMSFIVNLVLLHQYCHNIDPLHYPLYPCTTKDASACWLNLLCNVVSKRQVHGRELYGHPSLWSTMSNDTYFHVEKKK